MNCLEIREIISADLDFQTSDEQLILAFKHLAECKDCRQWRNNILEINNVFASIENRPVPDTITERLRQPEKAEIVKDISTSKKIYTLPRRLVWAVATIIIIQFGWFSYRIIDRPSGTEFTFDSKDSTTIVLTANDRTSATITTRMPNEFDRPNNIHESLEEEN
jgi:predicted anti-sigma-YlaC factor YlaD